MVQASAMGRVLVVEDEGLIARDIGAILRSNGYEIAGFAESGFEAIQLALTGQPDVVLMDIRIRGDQDGIETAQWIREKTGIPVVYLTSHADDATLKRASATEPLGYIVKPFTPETIKATMGLALQRRQEQREAQEREDQLSAANEILQQLSRTLVHDLNEPIRTVSMASQMLRHQWNLDEAGATQECLNWITTGCHSIQGMITSLTDYYRTAEEARVSATRVKSGEILLEVSANLQAAILSAGATVEAEKLPDIYAQPIVLTLLLQNLIANALKYRRDAAPHIRISAKRDGSYWMFTVADNGCGFDQHQSEHIFSLFGRAHGREIYGCGIGLATCRKLVEQFGGTIWANSKIGEGSQFHFTLPAEPAPRDPS